MRSHQARYLYVAEHRLDSVQTRRFDEHADCCIQHIDAHVKQGSSAHFNISMLIRQPRSVANVFSLLSYRSAREGGVVVADETTEQLNESVFANDADALRNRELAALIASAAAGDARAFEVFYERTVHFVNSIARRIVGSNYLEDVLADAYFQAWRDASRFDASRGNAMSWIITITRSRALDRLRQENVRHAGMSGAPDADAHSTEDETSPGPDTLLEQLQSTSALHRAMATLSVNERWCLALAYYREHSHSEIAAFTGLPLGTVKSLINRSQQKLRELLSDAHASARARS
jgi:RNA polymerase sigma-70 factor, ECF subfamily